MDGYDALLARWPVPAEPIDVSTRHGTVRFNACGPEGGAPLVLLPGFGTSSAYWYGNVGAWSRTRRVYALDRLGDRGRSKYDGEPITDLTGLMSNLDACLDGLGIDSADLCGHSYGAWTVLRYALHAPSRVRRAVLLDPTQCFSGLRLPYLLHALPMLIAGTPWSRRHMLRWESGAAIDAQVLDFLIAPYPTSRPKGARLVLSREPSDQELRTLTVPTLVLMAGRGRQNDNARVAATAARYPAVSVGALPTATHHSIPFTDADELNRAVLEFLDRPILDTVAP